MENQKLQNAWESDRRQIEMFKKELENARKA